VPGLSLYAGAGTSVNPSIENLTFTTPSEALVALKPEKSRTYELGAKWDGMDGLLILTGALFRIDKVNARTDGLVDPDETVLEGKQRVDGIELGATGRITPKWQILAAYTYLDGEVRESNDPAELGNRLGNVPKHSGSLWTLYDTGRFEIGGGVRYVGERFTNLTNARRIDDYWLAEATLAYEISAKATLRLNVFNIFDEEFIDATSGGHFVPGPGRQAVATLAFRL
jgi:catecholate siderophore receptor